MNYRPILAFGGVIVAIMLIGVWMNTPAKPKTPVVQPVLTSMLICEMKDGQWGFMNEKAVYQKEVDWRKGEYKAVLNTQSSVVSDKDTRHDMDYQIVKTKAGYSIFLCGWRSPNRVWKNCEPPFIADAALTTEAVSVNEGWYINTDHSSALEVAAASDNQKTAPVEKSF